MRLCYTEEESAKLLGRRGRCVGTDIEMHGRAGLVGWDWVPGEAEARGRRWRSVLTE